MANKFMITAKGNNWGGVVKKGEVFIIETIQAQPSTVDLVKLLKKEGRNVTSSGSDFVSQSWDVKKM